MTFTVGVWNIGKGPFGRDLHVLDILDGHEPEPSKWPGAKLVAVQHVESWTETTALARLFGTEVV